MDFKIIIDAVALYYIIFFHKLMKFIFVQELNNKSTSKND